MDRASGFSASSRRRLPTERRLAVQNRIPSPTTLVAFVRHFFQSLGKNCRSRVHRAAIQAPACPRRVPSGARTPRVLSLTAHFGSAVMPVWHSHCWTSPRMDRLPDGDYLRDPNGDDPDRHSPGLAKPGSHSGQRKPRNRTAERSADSVGRTSPRSSPAPPLVAADPAVEQLKHLLLAEAGRFRQNTSVSMSVVICMDEQTELLVHFTQRNGGVNASARCERGNTQQLSTLWPVLQRALAPRRVDLAPLRSAFPDRLSGTTSSVSSQHPQRRGRRSSARRIRPGWDTWA